MPIAIWISRMLEQLLIRYRFRPLVNPFSKQHGAPSDSERHVGDLGNFKTDAQGNSKGSVTDNQIKLIGPESVLGVSVALRA